MGSITKIANSVAIIMDGNGRWAQSRGLERVEGHVEGVESVRCIVRESVRLGVKCLTLYAFSTENWGRPTAEVDALMELMGRCFIAEIPELKAQGVKLRIIGDKSRFSAKMQELIEGAERETAECDKLLLQVALNYSSRDELRRGVQTLAERVAKGEIAPDQISEEMISEALDTAPEMDPDLVIRTSGEQRLSNFLLWQAAYSEFYFTDVMWPDFDEEQFRIAIQSYSQRKRRYGLVVEE